MSSRTPFYIAVLAFSLSGCASPTIILKSGKSWQAARDVRGVSCIVKGEDGKDYPAKCKLNAGDFVVCGARLK